MLFRFVSNMSSVQKYYRSKEQIMTFIQPLTQNEF